MEEVDSMPSNSQEFCLRWNNFHSSLVSALDGFKNDLDFVDVTLACEGQFLKAHKMLLSACSVFFRDLLKANPCQHPIVILPPEVRFIDLEKMLRFIYQGEVNVHQENLARFLKTAEMLKIRGLAEDNEKQKVLQATSPRPPENSSSSIDRGNNSSSVSPKRPRLSIDTQSGSLTDHPHTPIDENSHLSGGDSDSEMIPVKQEMIELKECDFDNADDSFLTETYLRENVSGTCSNNTSNSQSLPTHPAAPPPPGPLLPSYVPPPQIKAQDDSPDGVTCQEDVSQGRADAEGEAWRALQRHQEAEQFESQNGFGNDIEEICYDSYQHQDFLGQPNPWRNPYYPEHHRPGIRERSCPVCGRKISNLSNLRKHINRAHGTASSTCPVCGKAYRAYCDLRRHALASHNIRLGPFTSQGATSSPTFSSLLAEEPFPVRPSECVKDGLISMIEFTMVDSVATKVLAN